MNQDYYLLEFQTIIDSLPAGSKDKFLQLYIGRTKNPTLAVGLNAYFGVLGADRFYANDILLGILKLLTLGGGGFWVIVDLFLIGGKIRSHNLRIAREIKNSMQAITT